MRRFLLLLPLGMAVFLLLPNVALAHERRTIANGKYDVVVGWDVEPAYVGQKNAAGIRISQAGTNPAVPVQGAEKTLKVQIRQGAATKEFPLRAVFGQNGYYVADILPTRAGDHVWTFVGSINGDAISEVFDTADGKFDAVQPITAIEFPAASQDADVQAARNLAYVGIALGLVGMVSAAAAWRRRSAR